MQNGTETGRESSLGALTALTLLFATLAVAGGVSIDKYADTFLNSIAATLAIGGTGGVIACVGLGAKELLQHK